MASSEVAIEDLESILKQIRDFGKESALTKEMKRIRLEAKDLVEKLTDKGEGNGGEPMDLMTRALWSAISEMKEDFEVEKERMFPQSQQF